MSGDTLMEQLAAAVLNDAEFRRQFQRQFSEAIARAATQLRGGERLVVSTYIPKQMSREGRRARAEQIRREYDGHNVRALATRHGLTPERVLQIVRAKAKSSA